MIKIFHGSISEVEDKLNNFIKENKIIVNDIKLSETVASDSFWNTTVLIDYDEENSINLNHNDIKSKAIEILEDVLKIS